MAGPLIIVSIHLVVTRECALKSLAEFCYNLRYVEKNDRNRGNQWSLRQTGVYQRVDLKCHRSTWILLQPSNYVRKRLEENLKHQKKGSCSFEENPMILHTLFLSAAESNWREYIADLQSQLDVLVRDWNLLCFPQTELLSEQQDEKASFSTVGKECTHDFSVEFSDSQSLHLLRQKLLRASSILDSCLGIIKGCENHSLQLRALRLISGENKAVSEFRAFTAKFNSHQRRVAILLQKSTGTASLVCLYLTYFDAKRH
jgi:hypothetical protein